MTYGNHGPGGHGPAGPQYPYGPPAGPSPIPAPMDPYHSYGPYGAPPGPGGYPPPGPGGYPPGPGGYPPPGPGGYPPPLPYPSEHQNTLATLSIVFAFVFAPIGALLGHLALDQIKRTHERGHDRAVIGLTLSYAVIALAVVGLTASLLVTRNADDSTTVAGSAPPTVSAPTRRAVPPPARKPAAPDLSGVLLNLDEVRALLNKPALSETQSTPKGGSGGSTDASADPPECIGAVAPGIDTVYDKSGATAAKRASFSDPSTATMVDQVAASFATPSAARAFVTSNRTQWQQCAGKPFSVQGSTGTLTWDLGTPGGGADRITLSNTITKGPGIPQQRLMAVRGSVVIDISVIAKGVTDEADVMADRILARIPS